MMREFVGWVMFLRSCRSNPPLEKGFLCGVGIVFDANGDSLMVRVFIRIREG